MLQCYTEMLYPSGRLVWQGQGLLRIKGLAWRWLVDDQDEQASPHVVRGGSLIQFRRNFLYAANFLWSKLKKAR